MDRLLIDLSWNSSRLEGNTYSLLDTRRLIAFDEEVEGATIPVGITGFTYLQLLAGRL